ncbi:hypothetical protein EIP86_006648 [Pleurotus ostreatoroseus]|nr:hypothetical protein EIP86_006648 [Pleurotus ostreatoroseus]
MSIPAARTLQEGHEVYLHHIRNRVQPSKCSSRTSSHRLSQRTSTSPRVMTPSPLIDPRSTPPQVDAQTPKENKLHSTLASPAEFFPSENSEDFLPPGLSAEPSGIVVPKLTAARLRGQFSASDMYCMLVAAADVDPWGAEHGNKAKKWLDVKSILTAEGRCINNTDGTIRNRVNDMINYHEADSKEPTEDIQLALNGENGHLLAAQLERAAFVRSQSLAQTADKPQRQKKAEEHARVAGEVLRTASSNTHSAKRKHDDGSDSDSDSSAAELYGETNSDKDQVDELENEREKPHRRKRARRSDLAEIKEILLRYEERGKADSARLESFYDTALRILQDALQADIEFRQALLTLLTEKL